jgi:tRNA threonylcarbamoyl adenosine modification protein (Sua5/YciO/YrdC/YwlC family)
VSYRYDCADSSGRGRGLTRARAVLGEGELVVVPTESAYGIACDAFSSDGLAALRAAKRNPGLRPPVLIGNGRTLDGLAARVSEPARALAEAFWPGPLTLICHAQPSLDWGMRGGGGSVTLRMPLHPVALELLAMTGPLALTAANLPGLPVPATYDDAFGQLGDEAAVYLDAGHAGYGGPSTVVDGREPVPRVLRQGDLTLGQLREVVPGVLDEAGAQGARPGSAG